jgi:DNA-binding NtrC family response regulator
MSFEREFQIAAQSGSHVLLTGPTGVGKSRLAAEIHARGPRAAGSFVTVNLATLHEGLFESELFGHERGAFTGADQRRAGRLEQARGGTVFLDEIGELPLRLQARLLEFLQLRTVRAIGSNEEQRLDVRVIAATHRDLRSEVEAGRFREDLLHRLRVVSLRLPSLAEQPERFDEIVHAQLDELSRSAGKSVRAIDAEAADRLESHDWPGNFRELRHVLEYAVAASEGGVIRVTDLPSWFLEDLACRQARAGVPLEVAEPRDYQETMGRFERDYLSRALARTGGRVSSTARDLRMSKTTLLRRMAALGLRPGMSATAGLHAATEPKTADFRQFPGSERIFEKGVAGAHGFQY